MVEDRIVKRPRKELHQATLFADIILDLPPFGLALSGQPPDLFAIHPVRHGSAEPSASGFQYGRRIFDGQKLERLIDLAASQVNRLFELKDAHAVAFFQRPQYRSHPLLPGKGCSSEVLMDVFVLGAGHQNSGGVVNASAGATDLLVIRDDGTRRLVMDDETEIRLVVPHAESRGRDQRLYLVSQQSPFEMPAAIVGVAEAAPVDAAIVCRSRYAMFPEASRRPDPRRAW